MRETESGRSMVEMLGVLAVIGVLSVGGIAGYMMAMNRHHSNSILAGVSARAITVSAEKMMGHSAMHPADMETNIDGYPVTVGEADDVCVNCFEVVVSDVPQGPCQYTLNQNWATPVGIYLNDSLDSAENGSDCSEENNTIAFVFDTTLDADTTEREDRCTAYVGTSPNETGGYAGMATDGKTACYCPEGKKWKDGNCFSDACATGSENCCESYQDCGANQYCQFTPTGCIDSQKGTGTCVSLTSEPAGTGGDFLVGPKTDWWSAVDWCTAHHMHLLNAESSPFNCRAKDFFCPDWSEFTSRGLKNGAYWTSNRDSSNERAAWALHVGDNFFGGYCRQISSFHALCAK